MHAPQSGRPLGERKTWWEETQEIANAHCKDIPLIALIDANAKSGPKRPPIVFENDYVCSANTDFFINFLQAQSLYLPCTSQIHSGTNDTWTAPDGVHRHRIDYVAVPFDWSDACVHSSVIHDLDQGNANDDHQAVGIQLIWNVKEEVPSKRTPKAVFQREAIGQCRQSIECSAIKPVSWNTDIETQVQQLNEQLLQQVCKACPITPSAPKKRCFSGSVWELRAQKLALRHRIRKATKGQIQSSLRFFFQLWKSPATSSRTIVQHHAYEHTNLCIHFRLQCQYVVLARSLRKQLRLYKMQALNEEIATLNEQAPAGEILHCLKPFLGSTNPKKIKRACLSERCYRSYLQHACCCPTKMDRIFPTN